MTATMYFCYERGRNGKWCPCIYYDHQPGKTTDGGIIERSPIHSVPYDAEPSFAALCKEYPAPKETDQ